MRSSPFGREPASRARLLGLRYAAWLLDSLVLAVGLYSVAFLVPGLSESAVAVPDAVGVGHRIAELAVASGLRGPCPSPCSIGAASGVLHFALYWPLAAVPYYALSEALFATTVGKQVARLYVRPGPDGPDSQLGLGSRRGIPLTLALRRALARYVDGLALGAVGGLVAYFASGRRLGDVIAKTDVMQSNDPEGPR